MHNLTDQEIAELVIEATQQHFGIKNLTVYASRGGRRRDLVQPRQLACYMIRELTDFPFPKIASIMGYADHSTVWHSYRTAQKNRELMGHIPRIQKTMVVSIHFLKSHRSWDMRITRLESSDD